MPPKTRRTLAMTARAACVTIVALFSSTSYAAEFRVLSAAAMQSVFKEIRDEFQQTSGYRLLIHYGTVGAVNEWTVAGEEADLVISSSRSMRWLVHQGKIKAGSETAICETGIGIVTAAGIEPALRPSRTSSERFSPRKQLFTPARGGAAGIYVAKVIGQLGLSEQLKPKLRLAAGGDVTEVTLSLVPGALGITQISEIADKPQAQLVAPLPKSCRTTPYSSQACQPTLHNRMAPLHC